MAERFDLWVYLSASPLLWLTLTLAVWLLVDAIVQAVGRNPLANPVLISILLVAALLVATGTPYATYFAGAQFIHFLLGPATVALAVPLVRHWPIVRENLLPMLAALGVGSVVAVGSAVGLAVLFGLPEGVVTAIAPKSVTAGVAMAITSSFGGDPALTAVLVISTGVIGAVIVTPLMNAMGIRDYTARGFAVGLASHGIGTARAFTVDPVAGLFAGIAMGLNAVVTALIVPLLLR
ncbi:LrgB family protein [Methylobrevis albus]|uniref:LrgB family protein n=1 Tax=Methylobrevis albus TaxID=2793297 RepID=A0A931I2Z1_9HYPH|nr:LrgB family protein [Methylobrevis albus]MBH0238325.1 LrgB family protein [Methylobrevis albus]